MKSALGSLWASLLFAGGLIAVFVGERLWGSGTGRGLLSGLGVAAVLGAWVWRAARWSAAREGRRALERWSLTLVSLGVVALALYFLQSDLTLTLWGGTFAQKYPRVDGVIAALYPALLLAALLPTLLLELAVQAMAKAPIIEVGRARSALLAGLGLTFLFIFAFSAQYVATEADVSWDGSYFRTAKPGESTRKLVRSLNQPVQAHLFFPPANEVGNAVVQYFKDLSAESPQLKVEVLDQAVDPVRAQALNVSSNGTVVLDRDGRRETFTIGLELDRARGQLQRLDQEMQKRLLIVARAKRVVYFTSGHGERDEPVGPLEMSRPGLSQLKQLLRGQNVEVRNLGAVEGLANEVPADASLVAVMAPTRPLLPEEFAALNAYVAKGGSLWVVVEPSGADLTPLLQPLGVKQLPGALATADIVFRTTRQPSDHANLATGHFSSHPSVSTASSLGRQGMVAMMGASALEPIQPTPEGLTHDVTVRGLPPTFHDLNTNFVPDPGENRASWPLSIAVEKKADPKGFRALVQADADAFSDLALGNFYGNIYLALDALRWLTRDEALSGTVSSEEDVPVQHTRKQDVAWFYASVFVAPVAVLGVGFAATRRRRKAARKEAPAAGKEGGSR